MRTAPAHQQGALCCLCLHHDDEARNRLQFGRGRLLLPTCEFLHPFAQMQVEHVDTDFALIGSTKMANKIYVCIIEKALCISTGERGESIV